MRPDRSYFRTLELCCVVDYHAIPPTGGVARAGARGRYRRSLLTDLDTFFTKHHDCSDLDTGVNGDIVWIRCRCGAKHGHVSRRGMKGPAAILNSTRDAGGPARG